MPQARIETYQDADKWIGVLWDVENMEQDDRLAIAFCEAETKQDAIVYCRMRAGQRGFEIVEG